jgi:hypothetical protein
MMQPDVRPIRTINRRTASAMLTIGALATAGLPWGSERAAAATGDYMQPDASQLRRLVAQLAGIPRRRRVKALPMILTDAGQWDSLALDVVLAYDGPRQLFDTTQLAGPWINQMRNTLNAQVFSLQRPDFLCVGAPHGSAALALFTQAAWGKYKLAQRTGGAFQENSFLRDPEFPPSHVGDPANVTGLYSDVGNFVPTLQKRGAIFLGCHNAIWELASALLKAGVNPDRLSHEELAADLTDNLVPGVISTPGNEAVIGKLQESGFVYSYS